jgi:hypothetical protein
MDIPIKKLFRVFMILIALHSFSVGLGLIIIPFEYFGFFGFEGYEGNFFKIQGGVFHIVMCGAYIPAAIHPVRNIMLLRYSIFAKFTATLFLFSYCLLVEPVWMVLVSGGMDFSMGILLVWFNRRCSGEVNSSH